MLKTLNHTGLFCGILFFSTLSYAGEVKDNTVVTINGHPITQQDYESYVAARKNGEAALPDTQLLLDELINRELVMQDAIKHKVDQSPSFVRQMEILRGNLLTTMHISQYLQQHSVNEKELKAEYDKRVAVAKMPKEYKVRHIVLATEEQAKTILAQLQEGADFSKLAEEKSIDSGSARTQGDLGWITEEQVVPEVAQVIVKAEKGQYLEPVKSSFGWHVIVVDDAREAAPPSFEEVKTDLETMVQTEKLQDFLDKMRESATIEYPNKEKSIVDQKVEVKTEEVK